MATPIPVNHARFTLAEIADATGGEVVGDASVVVHGVFLDSRAPQPEGLFVALVGDSFDGHEYASGVDAAALLVSRRDIATEKPYVLVDSTEEALGGLAQYHRLRWGGPVVAITGSVGKTTTKEYCAAVLSACGASVCATKGNLNNLVGAPMSVLTLDDSHDIGVFEIGTSEPGEIEALAAITLPNVGVVTAVGAVHIEGLGNVDAVAEEKLSLISMLDEGEHAILNGDDPRIARAASEAGVITFGEDDADVSFAGAAITLADGELRRRVKIAFRGGEVDVALANPGRGALVAASASIGVALALSAQGHLHFVPKKAKAALSNLPAPAGRMEAIEAGGVLWIDDAYNASPLSMLAALDDVAEIAALRGGRAVAVMGDMLELGALSAESHRDVLERANDAGYETLVFGDAFAGVHAAAHTSIDALIEALRGQDLRAGDVVLVKGSRSMRLERVLEAFGVRGQA